MDLAQLSPQSQLSSMMRAHPARAPDRLMNSWGMFLFSPAPPSISSISAWPFFGEVEILCRDARFLPGMRTGVLVSSLVHTQQLLWELIYFSSGEACWFSVAAITNERKCSSSKQHRFISTIPPIMGLGGINWVLCSESHRVKIKV